RLTMDQLAGLDEVAQPGEWVKLDSKFSDVAGESFLITGTGKFLRNLALNTMENAAFIELDKSGSAYRVIYGYTAGGAPTCELSSHLGTHNLMAGEADNPLRVVLHCHPVNLIALTFTHDFDSDQVSKLLWQMQTESLLVFPDGVGVLDWMPPSSEELGAETAKMLKKRPVVIWKYHGVLATGDDLDQAFGRLHVAEKAADIYMTSKAAGGPCSVITDENLLYLAKYWDCEINGDIIKAKTGY
ncbi:MAG: rhamnulose-1-phosphate aldolase, partial [Gammaproteobacteria bacterium]|nr:rhamnulose-1-phosphate aldolase [Gammaproteobacteria bacterium]